MVGWLAFQVERVGTGNPSQDGHLTHYISTPGSQCRGATPTRMDKIALLLLLGGTFAQKRFFTTKFDDCGKIVGSQYEIVLFKRLIFSGSLLDIRPALEGSVKMTAPFNRNTGRHVLGKVAFREPDIEYRY